MLQPFTHPTHRRVRGRNRRQRYAISFTIAVTALFTALLGYGVSGAAMPLLPRHNRFLRLERTFDNNDAGLSNPIALALWPASPSGASWQDEQREPGGHFCVLDAGSGTEEGLRVVSVDIYGPAHSAAVELGVVDAGGVTYDPQRQRLLILDRGHADGRTPELIETGCGSDATVTRHSLAHLNLTSIGGIAFVPDAASASGGSLYFLDRGSNQLVGFAPDAFSGTATGAASAQPVTRIELPPALGVVAETASESGALAFDPHSRRFYILNPGGHELAELDEAGRLTATYEIAASAGLTNPRSLVIAPSSDLTDHPDTVNFYLISVNAVEPGSSFATNAIVELTLKPAGEPVPGVDIDPATLAKTTHTYHFSPPSPDPAGIAYIPQRKSLLISDSEVNEMNIFAGVNLFEVDLDGTLLGTLNTLSFSDEPTGVAHNPLNGDYFFSDDTGIRGIYHVRPGDDGLYGLGSASVTFSPSAQFGSLDPEGITYDPVQGHLFIVDGVNEEVYELSPGPNGLFDGLRPEDGGQTSGDDHLVNHFDVSHYGIDDPAGIEYNPDNGHLYIMANDNDLIAETYTDGALIRYIDISSIGARSPAGLAYGPSSGIGGQTGNSLYIVDRMVDNDSNPNENDGELYEINIPPYSSSQQPTITPSATQSPPTATPTSTPTATVGAPTPTSTSTPVATASPGPPEPAVQLHIPLIRRSQPQP